MADIDTKSTRTFSLSVLIFTVFFGLAAGIVGAALGATYFIHPTTSDSELFSLLRSRRTDALTPAEIAAALVPARNASVHFIKSINPKELSLVLPEKIASGVVFTADGWLISHRAAFTERQLSHPTDLQALIAGRAFDLEKIVVDPYSQAVFIKITANDLPVVSFAKDTVLSDSQILYAFDEHFGLRQVTVLRQGVSPIAKMEESVRVSESVETFLWTSGAPLAIGTVLFNDHASAVGVVVRSGNDGVQAVQFAHVAQVSASVLRGRGVERPYFGVTTTHEQLQMVGATEVMPVPGARVVSVARNSPAEIAGVRAGDILTELNGEAVSVARPFADILSVYAPGDTMHISFLRDGSVRTVQVELTTLSTP